MTVVTKLILQHVPLYLVVLALALSATLPVSAETLEQELSALTSSKFKDRKRAVLSIGQRPDARVKTILTALATGGLFYRKRDKRVVTTEKQGRAFAVTDALSGEDLGLIKKNKLKKIKANNSLRKTIKIILSVVSLTDPDPIVRAAAAEELIRAPSPAFAAPLAEALSRERDATARKTLELAVATITITTGTNEQRILAINQLAGSLRQEVRALLQNVANDKQAEDSLKTKARDALKGIEDRLALYGHIQNIFFGISLGSVLLLAAVGLAITFGVMGVINMAHGEMVMLGAYTTFVVQTLMPGAIEYSLFVAVPAAFLVAGLAGVVIERGVIRFLYGRPLETLLATFGLSLVLQQAVRTIFSPLNRTVVTPEWMSGSLVLNPALSLTYNRIYIIVFALLVLATLALVLSRTRFGLHVRAVTQNRAMARAMGIRSARVDALTFGLGSGVAGLAGVALSQLTNVGPNMGQAYIVDSFMVVVFGGVGNLLGTFFGAMTLGVVNKFLEPVTGTVLAKILVLVFIIIFIQRRPRGLFALSGRTTDG